MTERKMSDVEKVARAIKETVRKAFVSSPRPNFDQTCEDAARAALSALGGWNEAIEAHRLRRIAQTEAAHASESAAREMRERQMDGNRPLPFDRDELGRMVREAWVRWALTQQNPKSSWLVQYDALEESDKEADRQIGEAIARWTLIGDAAISALPLTPADGAKDE